MLHNLKSHHYVTERQKSDSKRAKNTVRMDKIIPLQQHHTTHAGARYKPCWLIWMSVSFDF